MPSAYRNRKKSSGRGHVDDDDDSSVDSRGNLRGFIAYSSEEEKAPRRATKAVKKAVKGKKPVAEVKKKKQPPSVQPSPVLEAHARVVPRPSPALHSINSRTSHIHSRKPTQVVEEEEEEEEEEEDIIPPRRLSRKRKESSTTEEEEDEEDDSYSASSGSESDSEDEEDEEDEDEYDEEDDSDYEDEDEEEGEAIPSINMIFGAMGVDEEEKMKPKRHNMKKEPQEVKKFVELITKPNEEHTIDTQIDMFKGLAADQQKRVLDVLENRNKNPAALNPEQSLMFKIMTMNLPPEIQAVVLNKFQSLQNLDPSSSEYFKHRAWLDKLTSLPLGHYRELPVRLGDGSEACGAFMARARKCLNDAIYGQEEAKLQILQYIGAKIANPEKKGMSLLLVGPPGIGKTALIKNGIAKAFDWPFQFISMGGDSDASTYTGHQLVYESSHCGKIVNSLIQAKSMSMILMFDEVDKISATPKGEEVAHLLIHMTDPVQNEGFEDKYLAGVPIDLGSVIYVFSANDIGRIDRVLRDRFVTVQLAGYNAKEKLAIAEQYLLPQALADVGLVDKVGINKEILQYVIEHYAGDEAGVRELKRCLEQIAQKINMLRMFNSKDYPFHIKEFSLPFIMKKEHVELFLKKKESSDKPPFGMYV
jgi:DNA polymerase III delta prime subunit